MLGLFLAFLIKQVPYLIHSHILLVYFQNISRIQAFVITAWLLPAPAQSSPWVPLATYCLGFLLLPWLSLPCSQPGSQNNILKMSFRSHNFSTVSPLFSESKSEAWQWSTGPSHQWLCPASYFLSSHPSGPYSDAIYVASCFSFLHRTLKIHILLIFLKRHIWCLATKHTFFCQHIWCLATNCETLTFPSG